MHTVCTEYTLTNTQYTSFNFLSLLSSSSLSMSFLALDVFLSFSPLLSLSFYHFLPCSLCLSIIFSLSLSLFLSFSLVLSLCFYHFLSCSLCLSIIFSLALSVFLSFSPSLSLCFYHFLPLLSLSFYHFIPRSLCLLSLLPSSSWQLSYTVLHQLKLYSDRYTVPKVIDFPRYM